MKHTIFFIFISLLLSNCKSDLNVKKPLIANTKNLVLKDSLLTIVIPELDINIKERFSNLDSVNNYNIPYFYNKKYISAGVVYTKDSLFVKPKKEMDYVVELNYNELIKKVTFSFIENPRANFSYEYISMNKGIYVEFNEVFELMNVAMTITKFNTNHNNEINFMINKKTDYYNKVINRFSPFQDHPLVQFLDKEFAANFNSYHLYTANAYCFNRDGKNIVNKGIYSSIWPGKTNFGKLLPLFNDFYNATNFSSFLNDNKDYYLKLQESFYKHGDLESMHTWLEKISGIHYHSTKYITSPLVFGGHKTQRFTEDEDFQQCLVFVPTIKHSNKKDLIELTSWDKQHFEALLFTEVDHNYVNPITDNFLKEINEAMPDVNVFNSLAKHGNYNSAIATFNEYLTHGLYLLYAREKYSTSDFNKMKEFWINQEKGKNKRGFILFEDFVEKLEVIYNTSGEKFTLNNVMPELLEWTKNQTKI